jgi:hypothetical protein
MNEDSWITDTACVIDLVGSNTGTPKGNAAISGSGKFSSNCGTFDGDGDYVFLGNAGLPASGFTFSLWVKPETPVAPGYAYIIGHKIGTNRFYLLYVTDTKEIKLTYQTSAGEQALKTGIAASQDEWHHIVVTATSSAIAVYLDGCEIGRKDPVDGSISYTWGNVPLGAYYNGASTFGHFKGFIDEVATYDVVLTPTEIRRLYADQKNNKHSNTETEVDDNLSTLLTEAGGDINSTVNPIAYLISDGTQAVELNNLRIDYTPVPLSSEDVKSFVIDAPSSASQNVSFSLTVTAKDASTFTTTGVTEDVTLTVDDGDIIYSPLPIPASEFQNDGVWTGDVTIINTTGSRIITATMTNPFPPPDNITGQDPIEIKGPVDKFDVEAPSFSEKDPTVFSLTITARDSNGDITKSVTNDVNLSVNGAIISPNIVLSSQFQDDGTWTGNVSIDTYGARTITAQSGGATGEDTMNIGYIINSDETWTNNNYRSTPTVKTYGSNVPIWITNNATVTFDSINKVGGAGQITLSCLNLIMGYAGGGGVHPDGYGIDPGPGEAGGGGAGYGGDGGAGYLGAGGSTYGSITYPSDLGSGGGSSSGGGSGGPGGDGGGAIKLNISGTLTNNGTIASNGGDGDYGV